MYAIGPLWLVAILSILQGRELFPTCFRMWMCKIIQCAKEKYAASATMLDRIGLPVKHLVLLCLQDENRQKAILKTEEMLFPMDFQFDSMYHLLALPLHPRKEPSDLFIGKCVCTYLMLIMP